MAPAVDRLEALVEEGKLRHGNHPVLTMAAGNAKCERDAAGNRKLSKLRSTGRIDPLVALTMAIGVAARPAPVIDVASADWMTEWQPGRTRRSGGSAYAGLSCASTRFVRHAFRSAGLSPRLRSTTGPQSSAEAIHFRTSISSPHSARVATTPRRAPSRWARIGCARAATSSATRSIPITLGTGAASEDVFK